MTDNQDNHYISQFLLKRWCNNSGKLTIYSRQNGRAVTSELTPRYTAFERNLYALEQVPSEKRHAIENHFITPRIDTPAALIVQKLLDGGFTGLTVEERSHFARFLLSLRNRYPGAIAFVTETGRELLTAALARDPASWPDTLVEYTRQNAPSLIRDFGVSLLPRIIADDRVCTHIFEAPWWKHDVRDANTDLLLSDRPCLLEGNAVAGEFVIVLPLSPTMLFFACNRERQLEYLQSMPVTNLVKMVNKASVTYAAGRVYGTGTHHLRLVEQYLAR